MIRKILGEEYLGLAKRFCKGGDALEAYACSLAAMRLAPDNGEAEELLRSTAALPKGKRRKTNLEPLRRLKRKLDRAYLQELSVAQVSPELFPPEIDPSADGSGRKSDPSENIRDSARDVRKELDKQDCRLKKNKHVYEDICNLIQALLGEDRSAPDGESCSEDDGVDWGVLSLEHQLHNLGNDLYKGGRYSEAIRCYNAALALDKKLLETYFNRALAYTRQRRYQPAHDDLCKAIELNPQLAEIYYTRGLVLEYQQDYDGAITEYDIALEKDPDYSAAQRQRQVAVRKRDRQKDGQSGPPEPGDRYSEGLIGDFSAFIEKPTSSFEEVGGCEKAVRTLRKIAMYLQGDPLIEEWGGQMPAGIILEGLPGVGKTHCVRALAGEVACPLFAPPPTVLLDMWAGNTEKNIRGLWAEAEKRAPSIIYIDEIDGFCCRRTRTADGDHYYNKAVVTILHLMDNIREQKARIVIIGATNRIGDIDPAFLRPGRFGEVVSVPLPNIQALQEIWLIHLSKAQERASRIDFLETSLRRTVRSCPKKWADSKGPRDTKDGAGIKLLARLCAQKKLTGADVQSIIQATIDDRILMAQEATDLGPITLTDLKIQTELYQPPVWCHRENECN